MFHAFQAKQSLKDYESHNNQRNVRICIYPGPTASIVPGALLLIIRDWVPFRRLLRLARLETRDRGGTGIQPDVDPICCARLDLPFRFVSFQKRDGYLIALEADFFMLDDLPVADRNHTLW